jgi:predicted cobalt transporter CbtA
MTKTLLSGGVIAGAIAGLVAAVFQFFLIQPLIVEAERYETGELVLIGIESNKPDPAPNPLETPGVALPLNPAHGALGSVCCP